MIPFVDLRRAVRLDQATRSTRPSSRRDGATQYILGEEVARVRGGVRRRTAASAHCVGVDSGTAAIQLGLEALGIGAGDEVIAPANTFIASVLPVLKLGATPVLVDCDPETGADRRRAGRRRRHRPRRRRSSPSISTAIRSTSTRCRSSATSRGRPRRGRVPGARRALQGTPRADRSAGSRRSASIRARTSARSATPARSRPTTTSSPKRMRLLRDLGERDEGHASSIGGWNERLDTLQAAVLRVKLRHLDAWNERRRAVAAAYAEVLDGVVGLPVAAEWAEHVWHLYVVRSTAPRRAARGARPRRESAPACTTRCRSTSSLRSRASATRAGRVPGRRGRAREQLSLPMFAELEPAEVERVAAEVAGVDSGRGSRAV